MRFLHLILVSVAALLFSISSFAGSINGNYIGETNNVAHSQVFTVACSASALGLGGANYVPYLGIVYALETQQDTLAAPSFKVEQVSPSNRYANMGTKSFTLGTAQSISKTNVATNSVVQYGYKITVNLAATTEGNDIYDLRFKCMGKNMTTGLIAELPTPAPELISSI